MTSDVTLAEDDAVRVSARVDLLEPWEFEEFTLPVPYRTLMWKAGIQVPASLAPNVYIGIDARTADERGSDERVESSVAPILIGRSSKGPGHRSSGELFVGNFQGMCVFQCSDWLEDRALVDRRVQVVGTCASDLIHQFALDFDNLVDGLDLREVDLHV